MRSTQQVYLFFQNFYQNSYLFFQNFYQNSNKDQCKDFQYLNQVLQKENRQYARLHRDFFVKVFDASELYLLIIVLVLSTFTRTELFHGRELSSDLFSIAVNKVLAFPQSLSDVGHISKKCVVIFLLCITSRFLIIVVLIFLSSPVPLDPYIPNVVRWNSQCSTR